MSLTINHLAIRHNFCCLVYMKKLILYIAMLLLTFSFAVSQETESKKEELPEIKQPAKEEKSAEQLIIDEKKQKTENVKLENMKQQRHRRKEHFIDKDGDGINDTRCNGLGIQRGKGRGKRSGQK